MDVNAPGMEADKRTGLQVPQGTRAREWQCRKGDRWKAEEAFRLTLGGGERGWRCVRSASVAGWGVNSGPGRW